MSFSGGKKTTTALVAVLGVAGVAILAVRFGASREGSSVAAEQRAEDSSPADDGTHEPVPAPELVEPPRRAVVSPEAEPTEAAPEEKPLAETPAYRPVRGDEWTALQDFLRDPDFLEASSRPEDVEPAALRALVKRGREVAQAYQSVEASTRAEAGLFQRLPGYVPGEPFTFPKNDSSVIRSYVFPQTGEGLQVDLPRTDYPELYELSDRLIDWEALLEGRAPKK